jgi:hypothetical protein
MAPLGGMRCPHSLAIAMELGFKVVRTMDWGYATSPLGGAVPCLRILSQHSLHRFERVLDGHGMAWLFHVKRHLKNAVRDQLYVACRNALARQWTS